MVALIMLYQLMEMVQNILRDQDNMTIKQTLVRCPIYAPWYQISIYAPFSEFIKSGPMLKMRYNFLKLISFCTQPPWNHEYFRIPSSGKSLCIGTVILLFISYQMITLLLMPIFSEIYVTSMHSVKPDFNHVIIPAICSVGHHTSSQCSQNTNYYTKQRH